MQDVNALANGIENRITAADATANARISKTPNEREGVRHIAKAHASAEQFLDERLGTDWAVLFDPFADLEEFRARLFGNMDTHR
ncbi:MAG TPA: hypothetical protein VII56_15900 [Rhizomicrobium sp.]